MNFLHIIACSLLSAFVLAQSDVSASNSTTTTSITPPSPTTTSSVPPPPPVSTTSAPPPPVTTTTSIAPPPSTTTTTSIVPPPPPSTTIINPTSFITTISVIVWPTNQPIPPNTVIIINDKQVNEPSPGVQYLPVINPSDAAQKMTASAIGLGLLFAVAFL